MTVERIIKLLDGMRLPLSDEKRLQECIAEIFDSAGVAYKREHRLNSADIVDFMIGSIATEVKVKGGKREIYRQVERYAQHDAVKELILITNVAMGFPQEVAGKPIYVLNLAKAWL